MHNRITTLKTTGKISHFVSLLNICLANKKKRVHYRIYLHLPVKQVKLKQLLHGTSFQAYPCLTPRVCTQSSLFQSFGCFGAQNLKLLISLFAHTKEPSTVRSFSPIQDLSPSWRCWINTFSSWLCMVTRSEFLAEQFDSAVGHEAHAELVK